MKIFFGIARDGCCDHEVKWKEKMAFGMLVRATNHDSGVR